MTENDILLKLDEWLLEEIGVEMAHTARYLESGDLDSFQVICFVNFVETTFKIRLQLEDLQSDDFNTLAGLAQRIKALLQQNSP